MESVILEYEKIIKKQKLGVASTSKNIDKLISFLESQKSTPSKNNFQEQIKEISANILLEQKDLYNSLGKFNKVLEKQKLFKYDLNTIWNPKVKNFFF